MRLHTKFRKHQKKRRIRKKKLSRAVQLAVLSMSVAPTIALADLTVNGVVSAATSIVNTDTITPAADFINADTANIQQPACQKRRIIADRRLEHAKAAA